MAQLKIKVENGATVVTVDEVVVSLTDLKLFCKGDNNGDDKVSMRFSGAPFGATLESDTADFEVVIDDALAIALKG